MGEQALFATAKSATRQAAVGALVMLTSACAGLSLQPPGPYADITPAQAVRAGQAAVGDRIRWGGELISTRPQARQTCFEVLALPLDYAGRPERGGSRDLGRFLACSAGFYDPALYAKGRLITLAGRIDGFTARRIGGYQYRMPVVQAGAPHLWPSAPRVRTVYEPVAPILYPVYVLPPPAGHP